MSSISDFLENANLFHDIFDSFAFTFLYLETTMFKAKHRLRRQSQENREKRENRFSPEETIKRKRSLGVLRKHLKTKPKSPDATGKLHFQRHTLAEIYDQLEDAGGDEITCNIAAWKNRDQRGGGLLTVEVSPEFKRYEQHTSNDESFDEIFDDDDE